jgi:hypothetical protein
MARYGLTTDKKLHFADVDVVTLWPVVWNLFWERTGHPDDAAVLQALIEYCTEAIVPSAALASARDNTKPRQQKENCSKCNKNKKSKACQNRCCFSCCLQTGLLQMCATHTNYKKRKDQKAALQ